MAAAKKFLSEGWKVLLADENPASLEPKFLNYSGEDVVFLRYNPADAKQSAVEMFGKTDTLGITADALVTAHQTAGKVENAEGYDLEQWNKILNYNVMGSFMPARLMAERLIRNNAGGTVAFLGSVCAKTPVPGRCAYSASMGAIRSLTKGLALDFGKHGIRVNCVLAGMESEFPVPLGKSATPEEIAEILYFFSTEASGSTTGAELVTDGGTDCLVPGAF